MKYLLLFATVVLFSGCEFKEKPTKTYKCGEFTLDNCTQDKIIKCNNTNKTKRIEIEN